MNVPSVPVHSPELVARNRRLGRRLGLLAAGMVAFTMALWYGGGLVCDWLGIGIAPGGDGPRSDIQFKQQPAVGSDQ